MARRIRVPVTPGAVVDYAGSGSAARRGTTLGVLFGLLIGIDLLRRGWPGKPIADMRRLVLGYAVAVFAFGVAAIVAPGFAAVLLGGIVFLAFVRAAPELAALLKRAADAIWPAGAAIPRRGFAPVPE